MTAETGLVGLGIFLGFLISVFIKLFGKYLKNEVHSRNLMGTAISLFAAMQVYGMINYSLRRNNGLLVWMLFGLFIILPKILDEKEPINAGKSESE